MLHLSFVVVLGCAGGSILLGSLYFRRYEMSRPPLSVVTLGDVAIMMGAVIIVPYLYLILPLSIVVGIFVLGVFSILYAMWEPVLHSRWAIWATALILLVADVFAHRYTGSAGTAYLLINDIVLVLTIVGIANLWAQGGMTARDVAMLALFLAGYDLIATSLLPLTNAMFDHLAGIPLTPVVAWGVGSQRLEIGLGDLLLATVFPLVMRKAFGSVAGFAAMAIELGAMAVMMIALSVASIHATLPLMTVLGPLLAAQYAYWRRERGAERTMRQYLLAASI
jgi:hypothetical protein